MHRHEDSATGRVRWTDRLDRLMRDEAAIERHRRGIALATDRPFAALQEELADDYSELWARLAGYVPLEDRS